MNNNNNNFLKEIGTKGGLSLRKRMTEEYNQNPNHCKQCSKKIEIKDGEKPSVTRQRNFCSKECRYKYQSELMRSKSIKSQSIETCCLNCGKKLNKRQKKFCSNDCQNDYQYKQYISRWKAGLEDGIKGLYQLSNYIIRYIKEKYHDQCCKCGWSKINPTTGKIPLEIHHKDGDYKNNCEDNLELLCPNCHSLTNTYKNSLGHKGRQGRNKYYKKVS